MLEDETVCINNAFYLVGRRDKDMAKKEQLPRKTFAEITEPLDPSLPIIVMDHQPGELSEASDAGVDLDLSGHTHDGQMFPANLRGPFSLGKRMRSPEKGGYDVYCHLRCRCLGTGDAGRD